MSSQQSCRLLGDNTHMRARLRRCQVGRPPQRNQSSPVWVISKMKKRKRSARAKRALEEDYFAMQPAAGALRFNDAARYLSIHPASLRRLWERGLIRSNRALRIHLFPVEELQRFLREGMDQ